MKKASILSHCNWCLNLPFCISERTITEKNESFFLIKPHSASNAGCVIYNLNTQFPLIYVINNKRTDEIKKCHITLQENYTPDHFQVPIKADFNRVVAILARSLMFKIYRKKFFIFNNGTFMNAVYILHLFNYSCSSYMNSSNSLQHHLYRHFWLQMAKKYSSCFYSFVYWWLFKLRRVLLD